MLRTWLSSSQRRPKKYCQRSHRKSARGSKRAAPSSPPSQTTPDFSRAKTFNPSTGPRSGFSHGVPRASARTSAGTPGFPTAKWLANFWVCPTATAADNTRPAIQKKGRRVFIRDKAVSHEKAQKAQKEEGY